MALAALSAIALIDGLRDEQQPASARASSDTIETEVLGIAEAAEPDAELGTENGGARAQSQAQSHTVHVVRVIADGCGGWSSGSGLALDGGRVLTARHVLDGAVEASVILDNGRVLAAEVVAVADDQRDGALLEVSSRDAAMLGDVGDTAMADVPQRGTAVAAIGYPERSDATARSGSLLGSLDAGPLAIDGGRVLTLDLVVDPGMSGGPVVDAEGALIGVAVGFDHATRTAIAVPIDELDELLDGRANPPVRGAC